MQVYASLGKSDRSNQVKNEIHPNWIKQLSKKCSGMGDCQARVFRCLLFLINQSIIIIVDFDSDSQVYVYGPSCICDDKYRAYGEWCQHQVRAYCVTIITRVLRFRHGRRVFSPQMR